MDSWWSLNPNGGPHAMPTDLAAEWVSRDVQPFPVFLGSYADAEAVMRPKVMTGLFEELEAA